MDFKRANVSWVVENRLCMGCGTCFSVCPQNAIDLPLDKKQGLYFPNVNEPECISCNLCLATCPGAGIDFDYFNTKLFRKVPDNVLLGNSLKCYFGYSTDYNIRYNSASGGLVSQLLIFALEEGLIEGALVTRMNPGNPLVPDVIIARTSSEILSASKSKYCPVPANIALKQIAKEEGKFAVVGLPCHIAAVRKLQDTLPVFQKKILLSFGLFCGRSQNFNMTRTLTTALKD